MLLPYVGFVYENKVVMELVQKRYKLIDILFHYDLNKQINLKQNKNNKLILDELSLVHTNPA